MLLYRNCLKITNCCKRIAVKPKLKQKKKQLKNLFSSIFDDSY